MIHFSALWRTRLFSCAARTARTSTRRPTLWWVCVNTVRLRRSPRRSKGLITKSATSAVTVKAPSATFVLDFASFCRKPVYQDWLFCDTGCKLLFRHETSKNWGKHCHSCTYCNCVSKKLVTAQYGGSVEEFCSEECRKKYTMLFCHVSRVDCTHQQLLHCVFDT